MIVEMILTRKSKPRRRIEHEAKDLLKRWPQATRVLIVRRGPRGVLQQLATEVALIYGGYKTNKVRLGYAVGRSTADIYREQRDQALVILRKLGFLGQLAMQMAQGEQKDAEATLLIARDALEQAGLDRLDYQNIVEIARAAVREFETEI